MFFSFSFLGSCVCRLCNSLVYASRLPASLPACFDYICMPCKYFPLFLIRAYCSCIVQLRSAHLETRENAEVIWARNDWHISVDALRLRRQSEWVFGRYIFIRETLKRSDKKLSVAKEIRLFSCNPLRTRWAIVFRSRFVWNALYFTNSSKVAYKSIGALISMSWVPSVSSARL